MIAIWYLPRVLSKQATLHLSFVVDRNNNNNIKKDKLCALPWKVSNRTQIRSKGQGRSTWQTGCPQPDLEARAMLCSPLQILTTKPGFDLEKSMHLLVKQQIVIFAHAKCPSRFNKFTFEVKPQR